MPITYGLEPDLCVADFEGILVSSALAERRPTDDWPRLEVVLRQADIIATAREGDRLAGVSRAITDLACCCYRSDPAVDHAFGGAGSVAA